MKKQPAPSPAQWERQYTRCRKELSRIGYISQGSVQDRTARTGGGAGYQWTRKVAGKTVTVALTAEQFQALRRAVNNRRKFSAIVRQMEKLSRKIIFHNHPHTARRKRLSSSVLGLN